MRCMSLAGIEPGLQSSGVSHFALEAGATALPLSSAVSGLLFARTRGKLSDFIAKGLAFAPSAFASRRGDRAISVGGESIRYPGGLNQARHRRACRTERKEEARLIWPDGNWGAR